MYLRPRRGRILSGWGKEQVYVMHMKRRVEETHPVPETLPGRTGTPRTYGSATLRLSSIWIVPTALCLSFGGSVNGLKSVVTKCFEPPALQPYDFAGLSILPTALISML